MGQMLAKIARARAAEAAAKNDGKRDDLPKDDGLNPQERKALRKMRLEAKGAGSFLSSGGKGGLSPSSVLGRMRKAKYRCQRCGELGEEKKNGGIGMHHRGGIAATKALSKLGHKNIPANLEVICARCHDRAHEKARARGDDSSQVLPEGDVGTKRDDGDKPVAHPD